MYFLSFLFLQQNVKLYYLSYNRAIRNLFGLFFFQAQNYACIRSVLSMREYGYSMVSASFLCLPLNESNNRISAKVLGLYFQSKKFLKYLAFPCSLLNCMHKLVERTFTSHKSIKYSEHSWKTLDNGVCSCLESIPADSLLSPDSLVNNETNEPLQLHEQDVSLIN